MKCPKCGKYREVFDLECGFCGVIYSKVKSEPNSNFNNKGISNKEEQNREISDEEKLKIYEEVKSKIELNNNQKTSSFGIFRNILSKHLKLSLWVLGGIITVSFIVFYFAEFYQQKLFDDDLLEKLSAEELTTKTIEQFEQDDGTYINPDEAQYYFEKAIEKDPQYARAYGGLGNIYVQFEEYEKAINAHDKAIELEPQNSNRYMNRCGAYAKAKNFNKAISDCTQAISLDDKNVLAYSNRGGSYYHSKNYIKACEDLVKSCELGDQNCENVEKLDCYNIIKMYEKLDQLIAENDNTKLQELITQTRKGAEPYITEKCEKECNLIFSPENENYQVCIAVCIVNGGSLDSTQSTKQKRVSRSSSRINKAQESWDYYYNNEQEVYTDWARKGLVPKDEVFNSFRDDIENSNLSWGDKQKAKVKLYEDLYDD